MARTQRCSRASWRLRLPSTPVVPSRRLASCSCSTVFDPSLSILAGSHRVQRVPVTEKQGRRHSSEITVVILDGSKVAPSTRRINRDDVRTDAYRGSGPGGQHRNTTDSAIRLTHLPTGTVVTASEERSQHQNRTVAWQRLEAKLGAVAEADHASATNQKRRDQLDEFRSWTWCGWRDEVKGPNGRRASMTRVLAGRLRLVL